jgi:hypothetical protein
MIYWHDKPGHDGSGFSQNCSYTWANAEGMSIRRPHLIKGLHTVDQIDPKEMILLLVVIDVHSESAITRITHKSMAISAARKCAPAG